MNPRVVGAAFALFSSLARAVDPNLFPNGDFSTGNQIAGWTLYGLGSVSWSTDNVAGGTKSGSMQADTLVDIFLTASESACFAVTPGAPYVYGGQSKAIAGSPKLISFKCFAFSTPNCTIPANFVNLPLLTMSNSFAWTAPSSVGGVLPNDSRSVQCYFGVDGGNSAASARADNLFFNSAMPTTSVRLQEFDIK